MELVGDDRSRSEARSPHERREALIGRDDEVRLFRADGLPMITGRDAEADVGGFEEIVEMVVDLAGQGPEGYEVGVRSRQRHDVSVSSKSPRKSTCHPARPSPRSGSRSTRLYATT